MRNCIFWQVRLVYAELIQHHFSYSKLERGSSGHSLCVKANTSLGSAGKALELALSFHSLVSCSNEQPLHALPSSWLALEGRSIWSSINVSFKIMRAREEGRGAGEFKPPNQVLPFISAGPFLLSSIPNCLPRWISSLDGHADSARCNGVRRGVQPTLFLLLFSLHSPSFSTALLTVSSVTCAIQDMEEQKLCGLSILWNFPF